MEIESFLESHSHNVLLTHYLKHCQLHPSLGPFLHGDKGGLTQSEPLEDLGCDVQVHNFRHGSLHQLIPRGARGYCWMLLVVIEQEHAFLQYLLKDPFANAALDASQIQNSRFSFSTQ